jgi:hypothetical protein
MLAIIVLLYLLVEYLLWRWSGWRDLQGRFRANGRAAGERLRWQSAHMGRVFIQASLNCVISPAGLWLWPSLPFGLFLTRRLLIPSSQLRIVRISDDGTLLELDGIRLEVYGWRFAGAMRRSRDKEALCHCSRAKVVSTTLDVSLRQYRTSSWTCGHFPRAQS